jgi:hypothetical protein
VQFVVARCSGSFGGGDQRRETRDLAERPCERCFLNPSDACPFGLSKLQLVDLAEQGHHDVAPSKFHGEAGSAEKASAAGCRLAEFRGASHRGHCYSDRAPTLSPRSRLLELERDVLMLAGEQSCAVPRPAVGLVRQHMRQCLMDPPTLP